MSLLFLKKKSAIVLFREEDIGKQEKFKFTFLCFSEETRDRTDCNLPLTRRQG